jgi:hypothetical protein
MEHIELSHVQIANLNMLALLSEYAARDQAAACSRFGLDLKQAEFLSTLSYTQILNLAVHLDECLFLPRHNLIQILSWPPEMATAMLMAHRAQS